MSFRVDPFDPRRWFVKTTADPPKSCLTSSLDSSSSVSSSPSSSSPSALHDQNQPQNLSVSTTHRHQKRASNSTTTVQMTHEAFLLDDPEPQLPQRSFTTKPPPAKLNNWLQSPPYRAPLQQKDLTSFLNQQPYTLEEQQFTAATVVLMDDKLKQPLAAAPVSNNAPTGPTQTPTQAPAQAPIYDPIPPGVPFFFGTPFNSPYAPFDRATIENVIAGIDSIHVPGYSSPFGNLTPPVNTEPVASHPPPQFPPWTSVPSSSGMAAMVPPPDFEAPPLVTGPSLRASEAPPLVPFPQAAPTSDYSSSGTPSTFATPPAQSLQSVPMMSESAMSATYSIPSPQALGTYSPTGEAVSPTLFSSIPGDPPSSRTASIPLPPDLETSSAVQTKTGVPFVQPTGEPSSPEPATMPSPRTLGAPPVINLPPSSDLAVAPPMVQPQVPNSETPLVEDESHPASNLEVLSPVDQSPPYMPSPQELIASLTVEAIPPMVQPQSPSFEAPVADQYSLPAPSPVVSPPKAILMFPTTSLGSSTALSRIGHIAPASRIPPAAKPSTPRPSVSPKKSPSVSVTDAVAPTITASQSLAPPPSAPVARSATPSKRLRDEVASVDFFDLTLNDDESGPSQQPSSCSYEAPAKKARLAGTFGPARNVAPRPAPTSRNQNTTAITISSGDESDGFEVLMETQYMKSQQIKMEQILPKRPRMTFPPPAKMEEDEELDAVELVRSPVKVVESSRPSFQTRASISPMKKRDLIPPANLPTRKSMNPINRKDPVPSPSLNEHLSKISQQALEAAEDWKKENPFATDIDVYGIRLRKICQYLEVVQEAADFAHAGLQKFDDPAKNRDALVAACLFRVFERMSNSEIEIGGVVWNPSGDNEHRKVMFEMLANAVGGNAARESVNERYHDLLATLSSQDEWDKSIHKKVGLRPQKMVESLTWKAEDTSDSGANNAGIIAGATIINNEVVYNPNTSTPASSTLTYFCPRSSNLSTTNSLSAISSLSSTMPVITRSSTRKLPTKAPPFGATPSSSASREARTSRTPSRKASRAAIIEDEEMNDVIEIESPKSTIDKEDEEMGDVIEVKLPSRSKIAMEVSSLEKTISETRPKWKTQSKKPIYETPAEVTKPLIPSPPSIPKPVPRPHVQTRPFQNYESSGFSEVTHADWHLSDDDDVPDPDYTEVECTICFKKGGWCPCSMAYERYDPLDETEEIADCRFRESMAQARFEANRRRQLANPPLEPLVNTILKSVNIHPPNLRPYLSWATREALSQAPTEFHQKFNEKFNGRTIHVDFDYAEARAVLESFGTSPTLGSNTAPGIGNLFHQIKAASGGPAGLVSIKGRTMNDVIRFVQDCRRWPEEVTGDKRIEVERREPKPLRQKKPKMNNMRRRLDCELGRTNRMCETPRESMLQMKVKLHEKVRPYRTFGSGSSDVVDIVWHPKGNQFAMSCFAYDDQYSRPNNLMLGNMDQNKLRILDGHHLPKPPNSPATLDHIWASVPSISFSCDGSLLYSGSYDKTVKIWHSDSSIRIDTVTLNHQINHLAAHSTHPGLLAAGLKGPEIAIINSSSTIVTGEAPSLSLITPTKTRYRLQASTVLFLPRLSSNPNWLITAYEEPSRGRQGLVEVYDISTGQVAAKVSPNAQRHFDLTVPQQGNLFITAVAAARTPKGSNVNSHVRIYDLAENTRTIRSAIEFDSKQRDINKVTISPCGRFVTSSGTDNSTYVWDMYWPNEPLHILRHGSTVSTEQPDEGLTMEDIDTGVNFCSWGSKDAGLFSERLWTGGSDGVVKCWDVRQPQGRALVRDVWQTDTQVMSGAWSPDGDWLAVGEASGRTTVLRREEEGEEEEEGIGEVEGWDVEGGVIGAEREEGEEEESGVRIARELVESGRFVVRDGVAWEVRKGR